MFYNNIDYYLKNKSPKNRVTTNGNDSEEWGIIGWRKNKEI